MKLPKLLASGMDLAQRLAPLVAVGALAGYSWWLVQSSADQEGPLRGKVAATVPDHVMERAEVERFDAQGVRTSVLRGERMVHVPEGDHLAVTRPEFVGLDAQGQHVRAQAAQGEYLGQAGVVRLLGQAQVEVRGTSARGGPLHFEGERLQIEVDSRVLTSDAPVVLRNDDGVLRGSSLRHESREGVTLLGGRVQGRLSGSVQAAAPGARP